MTAKQGPVGQLTAPGGRGTDHVRSSSFVVQGAPTLTPPPMSGSRSRAQPQEPSWDLRRDELERALSMANSDDERREIHEAFAELHELSLDEPKLALEHYQAALRYEPHNLGALRGLERVYYRLEMFEGVVDVLHRRVEIEQGRDEQVTLLLRLSDLYEHHFDDPATAIPLLWDAVSLDPTSDAAFDALQRCYRALEAWTEYAETVERRIETTESADDKLRLLGDLAGVLEAAGDAAAAMEALGRAREIAPHDEGLLSELIRLATDTNDWLAAATYRVLLAELGDDATELVHLHMSLAQLLEPEGGDRAKARTHYERVVALDPENLVAWEKLQRLALESGAYQRAAFCVMERANRAPTVASKADLFVELGRLWENHPKGVAHARSAYELALETDPRNEEASSALVRMYSKARRADPNSALSAERLLEAHASDGPHAAALFRVGTRVALNCGRAGEAMACAIHAFSLLPTDDAAAMDLVSVCHALRDDLPVLERAHAALRVLSQRATSLPLDLVVQLGQVQLARGEVDAAVECFVAALANDPTETGALASLSAIHAQREDWASRLVTERALCDLTPDPRARAARLRALAAMVETKLGDPARAVDLLVEAAELAEPRAEDLDGLSRVLTSLGDIERLADAHRRFFARYRREEARASDPVDRGSLELEALRERIRRAPLEPSHHRALYAALRKRRALDAALCVASVLEHLGAGDGDPLALLHAHRVRAIHELPGQLAPSHWYEHLLHPQMDAALTTVFAIMAAVTPRARPHGRTDALSRAAGELVRGKGGHASRVARDARDAMRILGVPPAPIVERTGGTTLIAAATLPTPALVLSPAGLVNADAETVPFLLGDKVAELHPLLAGRVAFRSVSELRMLLESAVRACPPRHDDELSQTHQSQALRHAMTAREHEELSHALVRLGGRAAGVDVDAWCLHAMATCARAGLLLAGSMDAAWRAVSASAGTFREELHAELVTFAVSDSHAALRGIIGAAY